MRELLGQFLLTFKFLQKFLQCEPGWYKIFWDQAGNEESL